MDQLKLLMLSIYSKNSHIDDYLINILFYVDILLDKLNYNLDVTSFNTLINNKINVLSEKYENLNIINLNYDVYLNLCISHFNITNYLEEITKIILTKQIKYFHKELSQLIVSNNIINKIFDEIEINDNQKIINLFSGVGDIISSKYNINNIKNIKNYESNNKLNLIHILNCKVSYNIDVSDNTFKHDIIYDELSKKDNDLVIVNIHSDIKNIIHANCCKSIKQLKIRGTKSEPLIIQLVTTLLNSNGTAVVITPDSFLFNDSTQHIETRKYLLTNFKIDKIINIAEIKKSILIFSKKQPTQNITLINDKQIDLSIDIIKTKKYSLYYHNYELEHVQTNLNNSIQNLSEYINFSYNSTTNDEVLYSYNFNQLKIGKINTDTKYNIIFLTKDETQLKQYFLNHYLLNILNKHKSNLTKGKINQFDLDLISQLQIKIPNIQIQQYIIKYIENKNKFIDDHKQQLNILFQLKNNIINSIILKSDIINLNEIANVENKSYSSETIQINKNSSIAGHIGLTINNSDESTNMYYITNVKPTYNNKVLYYILKYYENEIIKLANQNASSQLAKSKLENFKIPNINEHEQNEILKCEYIDNKIKVINEIIDILNLDNIIDIYNL
jgi:hypothetical protein